MPTVSIATGLPVSINFLPDGTMQISVDVSEALDDPTVIVLDGEEVEELDEDTWAWTQRVLDRLPTCFVTTTVKGTP